tara:strand:- start:222 stop:2063 length:1842 start_codon:yes stop_codon:yes gene_type:complete
MKKKKVFLVTTSLKETFPENRKENILLAGEWCKIQLSKRFLSKYKTQTLSYHWEDERKKSIDAIYLKKVYYKLEKDLSLYLNEIHQTSYSTKYWSIIISPWLSRFVINIFDRYSVVKKIKKEFIVKKTKTISFKNYYELVAQNWKDQTYKYQSHNWNHSMFALLMQKLLFDKKRVLKIRTKSKMDSLNITENKNIFKKYLINLYSFVCSFFRNKKEIFVINSYLGYVQETLLNLKLNNSLKINLAFVSIYSDNFNKKYQINEKLRRKKISHHTNDDEFLKILKDIIPQSIPAYYLEGYKILSSACLNVPWTKNPKLIFTSNNHIWDEMFNFWTAHQLHKKKVPRVICQHGGSFFTHRHSVEREIEIEKSDKFLAWGDARESGDKIINFFDQKSIFKKQSYNLNGKINLIQGTPKPYQMFCVSGQLSLGQIKNNIEMQKKFLRGLSKNYLNKTEVRLYYPYAFKASHANNNIYQNIYERDLWLDNKLNIKIEKLNTPMSDSINDSRLLIYNALESTLFLETMHKNIPSILLMKFDKSFVKKKDLGIFKSLKDNGILYDDPKALANFLNLNFNNIDTWWKNAKVQKTVKKFCNFFTATNEYPIKQFKETFDKILK